MTKDKQINTFKERLTSFASSWFHLVPPRLKKKGNSILVLSFFISNSGTIHERGRGAIMSIAVIVTTEKMFMVVYCRTLLRVTI